MMEIIIRIAEEKYIKQYKTTSDYFEALELLYQNHLK
jgi:hypothetical protein